MHCDDNRLQVRLDWRQTVTEFDVHNPQYSILNLGLGDWPFLFRFNTTGNFCWQDYPAGESSMDHFSEWTTIPMIPMILKWSLSPLKWILQTGIKSSFVRLPSNENSCFPQNTFYQLYIKILCFIWVVQIFMDYFIIRLSKAKGSCAK